MRLIGSPKKIFGLDISDLSIKAIEIGIRAGKKYIRATGSAAVPLGYIEDGEIKNEEGVAEIIKKILEKSEKKFTSKYAVLSLPETKTFIKVIEIPEKNQPAKETIREELPRHMPISSEDVQMDWQGNNEDQKNKKFLVGVVPQSVAEEYTNVCKMAGVGVAALEIEAQAIARSVLTEENKTKDINWLSKLINKKDSPKNKNRDYPPKIIVDFGATRTSLILVDEGFIQFTNNLNKISGKNITDKISRELSLSEDEAEKAKIICGTNPKRCKGAVLKIINNNIDELINEIINADNFYQTHFGKDTSSLEIVLCGGGANMFNLDGILEDRLGRKVEYGDPLKNIETKPEKREGLLSYTTAIGLALRNYLEKND